MSTKIGHYDLVTELGRGGMGVVYKGFEPSLNRYVAIKMLSPSLAHDEAIKERFLREARSMAALSDPHIIQIYYIGEQGEQPFFAMEFVEGESLSSFLKREGKLSPQQAARVIYQTAQGLASAHDRGVIHRDIKPGNLMLDQRGRIKIADFGIALSQTDFSKKLTSTGEFVGTPGYLSPEVCTGQRVDLRSDIFSLGIVFFELLTGRMPFTDESPLGLLLEVVRAEIPDVRQLGADVDEELVRIIRTMTAKDPTERYQDCHQLAADLAKHPLVAGAVTITAKPVMSPAAATVVGMKTPPQLNRAPAPAAGPATVPTPVPSSSVAAQAHVSEPTPAPRGRASVMEAQEKRAQRGGGGAIIAIAAVLLLALGGGAWAFRDRLGFGSSAASATASTPAPATSAASPAAAPSVASVPAATSTDGSHPADASGAHPAGTGVAGTNDAGTTAVATATTSDVAPATTASTAPTSAPATSTGPQPDPGLASAPDDAELADEELEPVQRLAQDKGRLARLPEAPRRADPPRDVGPPKVAVVALGDPAITGPARQIVEEELMNEGFIVVDSELVPGLEGAARNGLPALFGLLARANNVRAVTVIRAEGIGQTQLNYYGQSDTLYSASLSVRSYDVRDRRPLNAGARAKVDFTALNADAKAREAIEPELRRLLSSLAPYRPKARG